MSVAKKKAERKTKGTKNPTAREHVFTLRLVFERSGKWLAVSSPSLPSLHTQGRTMKEAIANAKDAFEELLAYDSAAVLRDLRKTAKRVEKDLAVRIR